MDHENLLSLAIAAQDGLARLEAGTAAAPSAVRDGLLARLACREAAGWLAQLGTWVHPVDLALRDAGLTGSYGAAELGSRLPSVLPATVRAEAGEKNPPEDRDVAAALRHGRTWRRLAELRSWSPDSSPLPGDDGVPAVVGAALIVAEARFSAAGALRAGWLWRERGGTGYPGFPLFSAPVAMLHRVVMAGLAGGVLEAVAEAARQGSRELARLNSAAERGRGLGGTKRSHVAAAVAEAVRRPVVTARMLSAALGVSQRAAFGLIDRLEDGGVLREATGRASWRAFVVI